ncbi:serine/threonine-protein kinase [Stackebrandtia nassauensis]|uniref:non-specific serine/threonine protein kinase n=1 Tax=Stackebrandtia nassauensis (strain DSM 44728 / CIP 108903 / NRRL B-16338 / NBRC 102104 / LLR-40K-21) TaxID=446470 RepID=D3Q4L1_STANL|nr:serine/threonine-protein kinase [Stackebrandtia nassauensis]ADD40171.1 serine/threonine protein kinase [Stackebrandtia nassauensis DSM 44728]
MGEVWRGDDTRLNRPVAVKLLHSSLSENKQFRERFAREATLVAGLKGQHVATVYDYGEEDSSGAVRSYLVMELVDGRPLSEILDERGPLPVPETVRVIGQAAEGLRAAHEAGIIHRDVKPANILLTPDGSVKLIDFGIAHLRGKAGLTDSGIFLGTLAYVCPDQIADEEPTPSTDIYSLGVVAYECLTGSPPFASDVPAAVLNSHLYEPPPPLPEEIPAHVSHAILMALRKRPEHRWQTMAEFAQGIRNPDTPAPPPEPTSTPDPETPARAPKRKLQWLIQGAMAVVIAILSILLWQLPWQIPGFPGHGDNGGNGGQQFPGIVAESDEPAQDDTPAPGQSETPDVDDKSNKNSSDDSTPESAEEADTPTPANDNDDGGNDETASVPRLKGKNPNDATALLNQHGFHNHNPVRTDPQDGKKQCVVYRQSPRPNTTASTDTTITYYYRADPKTSCDGNDTQSDDDPPPNPHSTWTPHPPRPSTTPHTRLRRQ